MRRFRNSKVPTFREESYEGSGVHPIRNDEHGGWEGIVAARVDTGRLKQLEGKTIAEIAKIRGQDPVSTCFDMIYMKKGCSSTACITRCPRIT